MQNVRRWFDNDCENYRIIEYDVCLEATTDFVHYLIVEPHSGTDDKWMLRVTTKSAFDRWANSVAIAMFFETSVDLCDYLTEHQLDIYKQLLEYLSAEYEFLNFKVEVNNLMKNKYN